jgi:hypothetical protein
MPAPDADVPAETPAGDVPFTAPFPERKRFSGNGGKDPGCAPGSPAVGRSRPASGRPPHQATQLGSSPRALMPRVVRTRTAPMSTPGRAGNHPTRPQVAHDSPCGALGIVRPLDEMTER